MTHPYHQHKEIRAGQKRAKEMAKHFKRGGKVHGDEAEDKALIRKELKKHDHEHKAVGGAAKPRLDKYARGGGTKKHGKGHHTHINIVVAPKGGDAGAPPLPPGLGAGGPPVAPPVPKAPMAPPAGALGAGLPGGPPPGAGGPRPPGLMKRGGKVYSGLSTKANIEHWAKRTGENTRYSRGGNVKDGAIAPFEPPHMKGGAGGARGRMDKKKAYGITPHIKDGG